jgi:hypothetical protein
MAARVDNRATRRTQGSRQRWVRKNMIVDQRKLDEARRTLGTATETDTVDRALDLVAFRQELSRGFTAMRKNGGFEDVFEDR